jgi:heme exporter protein D
MIPDLGPHAAFIWSAYGSFAVVLGALIAWLLADGAAQARKLADFEARGIKRRSDSGA